MDKKDQEKGKDKKGMTHVMFGKDQTPEEIAKFLQELIKKNKEGNKDG